MDKRRSFRFDKAFPVDVTSKVFGEYRAVARNISTGGMFLEVADPLPLGSVVKVHFAMPDSDDEIVARGEVKGHYYLNFADREGPRSLTGMGVRFTGFEDGAAEALEDGLSRMPARHTLH